ncbi:hypothetical protein RQP46_005932 [Phenoliferia psychrophenolica]
MGSAASKVKSKPLASGLRQPPAATLPSARRQQQPAEPLRASGTKSEAIEQDGHDPTFLSNLNALGQVHVPKTQGLFRSDNRMLDILAQRRANEVAEETPSTDRISAQSLSNLFDECKAVSSRAEMESIAKEYGMDVKLLESLGRFVTAPSVASVRTKKEELEETQLSSAKVAFDHVAVTNHLSEYSDVQLIVAFQNGDQSELVFNLHAIVISRSPLLQVLLQNSYGHQRSSPLVLSLPILSPRITPEGVHLTLASLYSPEPLERHLTPSNASSVLATAAFLGLHSVAEYALELALGQIAHLTQPDEFSFWERFLGPDLPSYSLPNGLPPNGNGNGNSNGPTNGKANGNGGFAAPPDAFDPFRQRLRLALVERVPRFARESGAFGREPGGRAGAADALADVLAVLSFDLFKTALESSEFPIAVDMERFQFAKKCVAVRKRAAGPGPSDFEETVVLAFGNSPGATAVSVLRKARKPQLWKGAMSSSPVTEQQLRQLSSHYPRRDELLTHVMPVLHNFSSLRPEQGVYYHDDGRAERLLSLTGVIPVSVRGTTYHCPLVLYLPLDYPAKPPIVQVLPTATMQVKASAHVDAKTNRVVVPYMVDWSRKGEVSPLVLALIVLRAAR